MDLKKNLETAMREAMRTRNEPALRTIRMVMSAIKLAEVEKGNPLDEAGIIAVLQKEVKNRREAMSDAEKAGRADLVAASQSEIAILEQYLPAQLSDAELESLVRQTITEVQAASPADMGKVMKALMPKVSGRTSGDRINQAVRKILTG